MSNLNLLRVKINFSKNQNKRATQVNRLSLRPARAPRSACSHWRAAPRQVERKDWPFLCKEKDLERVSGKGWNACDARATYAPAPVPPPVSPLSLLRLYHCRRCSCRAGLFILARDLLCEGPALLRELLARALGLRCRGMNLLLYSVSSTASAIRRKACVSS